MSGCPTFAGVGPAGIAEALRVVDCTSGQAASFAFARIFGSDAVLGQALTAALTLYIGFFAVGLLTGRSALGLSSLTPRAMALGIALTFATSWIAYQSVVWNLLAGAPDQIASLLVGTNGGATTIFAQRLDSLFTVVAEAAAASEAAALRGSPAADSLASGPDLLWLSALLLLLGTVGVLVVARVGLAAMLALGPIFIICALFNGTRGLFEGWLKVAVMFALTPLFAVLIGGGVIALLAPMLNSLAATGGEIPLRTAVTIFLASAVYCMLMIVTLKIVGAMVAGWRLPFLTSRERHIFETTARTEAQQRGTPTFVLGTTDQRQASDDARVRTIISAATGGAAVDRSARPEAPSLKYWDASPVETLVAQPASPRLDPRVSSLSRHFGPRPQLKKKVTS